MMKISWLIGLVILFISSGCFDTVEETTINDNGGGVFVSTADMSNLISMVKSIAGDKLEAEDTKLEQDTLVNLKDRSEEHTSELQSQSNLVCRLLLEKKKKKYK